MDLSRGTSLTDTASVIMSASMTRVQEVGSGCLCLVEMPACLIELAYVYFRQGEGTIKREFCLLLSVFRLNLVSSGVYDFKCFISVFAM